MSSMTRSVTVHRPLPATEAVLACPDEVMAVIADLGRTARVEDTGGDAEHWEVFILLGTMYVGGRVRIEEAGDGVLAWHSESGFHHRARFEAVADGDDTLIRLHVDFRIDGVFTGWLAATLVQGYIGRFADAVLESLRHRIEYGVAGR
ncbi:SRPBCC family protein [Tomitella cavernea]|uniref:SRPBCC family protein n=1 Tax=Tomitella cavernea TaxID=1387982 RepID=A0ABP9CQ44_9ACTN|nr:SRPBCC family protein [Tomitella cavernea]